MKKLNKNGFSLVELIIVIAIMAVLIGLLAPQYLKYVERSRIQKTISDASTVCNAITAMLTDSAAHGDELYDAITSAIADAASQGEYTVNLMNPASGYPEKIADAINKTAGGTLDGQVTFYVNAEFTPSFSYVLNSDKYAVDYHAPEGKKHEYIMVDGGYGAYIAGSPYLQAENNE